jgi:hypothetical protein
VLVVVLQLFCNTMLPVCYLVVHYGYGYGALLVVQRSADSVAGDVFTIFLFMVYCWYFAL